MNRQRGFREGQVCLQIRGAQTERFLNLCRARGIRISRLVREQDESLTCEFSVKDFFRLAPVRRKTKVKIHILEKHGLPFFFYRSKKRKAFFLGIILCAVLLMFLSGRLWNIEITGNVKNSTPEILHFLEEQGIVHGMACRRIHCSAIAAAVREKYQNITWVSAELEGTKLLLTVKEGIFVQEKENEERAPCNITADVEGEIVKIITREGVPQKKPGETCGRGEILVSGLLELKNDSQEIVRYEAVHADADIYIKRKKAYYREIPLQYETEIPTGEEKKGVYIRVGTLYLGFGDQKQKHWQNVVEEHPLFLTESFRLPVSVGKISKKQYQSVKKEYTEKEVRARAWGILQIYEEKLIQKGVQISANNVKIEVDHKTCISKGFLEIIEKIGEETPVEISEQPAERTTEDG
ncbi:sporulation protein YqfD [Blautia sp. MSJ-19]|uniref:sporulation protein YqfD n=1 Tax=Blautia sp. MSJ-19 TaxID=2841517 RepID=UPI001C0E9163|nr:sporulation protein YqfD [Blautia sp. MSJ-19]MBU5481525.1 sporulation protein YqfD [Blautia sp. MSJ-19]